jgi:hypothetical protein
MRHRHPEPPDASQIGRRHARDRRLRVWSYRPSLGWLERRTLFAGLPDLLGNALPLALGSPRTATIAPFAATFYSVSSDTGGKLTIQLDAPALATRLSLVDRQGQPLVQSDGSTTGAGLIDVNVSAGIHFLEVQCLAGQGTYRISADLIPTVAAFQTVPTGFPGYSPIAAGRFHGTDFPVDLVAPDGIHVGNGDGTFQSTPEGGSLALPGWTVTAITAADFNNDGLPDIAFTETSPDGTTAQLCVLHNEGGGHFQVGVSFVVDPYPVAIQTIDFGSGIVDLAVADGATGNVAIFVGDGRGGFSQGPVFAAGNTPTGMVAGRFGDGHVDLIVAGAVDSSTGQGQGLAVFQADGPDAFQPEGTIPAGDPSAIVADDFSGDGMLDLAVADSTSEQVSILLNKGDGTFQAPRSYPVGSTPLALVAGYFGSGHLDLAVANSNSNDVSVLLGNGDGTFEPQRRFGAGLFPASLVTADLNGDGRFDLTTGNQGSNDISILLGRGDGTFQDTLTNPVGNGPVDSITADLNRDGHTDIVTSNYYSNDISVLVGHGDGTFATASMFPAGNGPTALAEADLNGDGRLDIAVADSGDSDDNAQGVSILLGNGDGTFLAPISYPAGMRPSSIVAGDWTGDGVIDLAVADLGSDDVTVLIGDGHGGFQAPYAVPLGDKAGEPVAITAGDFTGDRVLDLAVLDQSTNSVSILVGNRRGRFVAQPPIPLGEAQFNLPMAIVAGDFTGDHIFDLAVASQSLGAPDNVSILLGAGDGSFELQPTIDLGTSLVPSSIIAGNFFGGPLGLAVADSRNKVSLLQGDGRGGFQVSELELGGEIHASAVATGDFTGDGRTDLAIASQSPNSVVVELNLGNGQFAQPGSVGLVPHDTPLIADLNSDGVSDVVILDGAGDILFRQGQPGRPGSFAPPVTVNRGRPSRDIASMSTPFGPVLAAVDARGDAVSLYIYRAGTFFWVGSSQTGRLPAQLVTGDLLGDGGNDLLVRNAGDGTLTVIPEGVVADILGFAGGPLSTVTLQVGVGVSDVALVDTAGSGRTDIVVTNKLSGRVGVIRNLGGGNFGAPAALRAGIGLLLASENSGSVTSLEASDGVAAGQFTTGGPTDLLTVNPGSNTLGLLAGLGGGRFANPVGIPTAEPAQVARVADFNHDGIPDVAVLGRGTVSIYRGNGKGGFSAPDSYNAGLDPTGLSVADLGHDGNADLLIGNAYGDVLTLAGKGNGTFWPLLHVGDSVALAVADLTGKGTKDIIYASQDLDRVVVDYGGGQRVSVGESSGLLAPGAVVVADLNGDGTSDLVVADSGGNRVLVYPGLGNHQFGAALNSGKGFFTGTDPVGVTILNLNGRPDLVIADRGSNDVTILLNQVTDDGGFTFVPGPRLNLKTAAQQGIGPVATVIVPSPTGGPASLAVSLSGSNQVWVIPGVGGGFFNDQNPRIFNVGSNPGPLFVGNFDGRRDLVSVNAGSNDLSLISAFDSQAFTTRTIPSGGVAPVTAFSFGSGDGFDSLVVGNAGDGVLALFQGGSSGLILSSSMTESDVPSPSALVFSALTDRQVQFFAASAGREEAISLAFDLGVPTIPPPDPPAPHPIPHPVPLNESSLSLAGTLLFVTPQAIEDDSGRAPSDSMAVTAAGLLTGPAPSLGQSLPGQGSGAASDDDGTEVPLDAGNGPTETEGTPAASPPEAGSIWKRYLLGIDDAREEELPQDPAVPPSETGDEPSAEYVPWRTGGSIRETSSHSGRSDSAEAIDQALLMLIADETNSERAIPLMLPVSARPTSEEPRPPDDARVVPLPHDPACRNRAAALITAESVRARQIVVSLPLVIAGVAAERVFSSIQSRCVPKAKRFLKAL